MTPDKETNLQLANVPPHDEELEKAVLGQLLIDSDSINRVADTLTPELFYIKANKTIYSSIMYLFSNNTEIDSLTVTNHLKSQKELKNVGGPLYIMDLMDRVNSTSHLETHCKILQEHSIKRFLIKSLQKALSNAFDYTSDALECIGLVAQISDDSNHLVNKQSSEKISQVYISFMKEVDDARFVKNHLSGIPSPLNAVNNVTGGWQDSDLIIKAGRPAMGKTADMVTEVLYEAFTLNMPILVFSLEMSKRQLIGRMISQLSKINSQKLKTGKISESQFKDTMARSAKLSSSQADANIHIIDTPNLSISELRAISKVYRHKHGIKHIFVDYLQLVSAPGFNRENQISTIARSLKNIAKECNVPMTAYSQLSRKVEERGGDKKPKLGDLRESGEIEQAADIVIMFYRPEYYNIHTLSDGRNSEGIAYFIVEKYRGGNLGEIEIGYIAPFTLFCNKSEKDDLIRISKETEPDYIKGQTIFTPGPTDPPLTTEEDPF